MCLSICCVLNVICLLIDLILLCCYFAYFAYLLCLMHFGCLYLCVTCFVGCC